MEAKIQGQTGSNIVYNAYGQDVPQVSGGKEINNWVPIGNGLYKASALNLDFRQLYVNGVRATLARTPNLTDPNSFGPYNRIMGWENPTDKDQLRIKIHANGIANWTGLQQRGNDHKQTLGSKFTGG